MNESASLEGRCALITGGTRGIGLAIARAFVRQGARVTVCGRRTEGVEQATAELSDFADRFQAVTAHVADQQDQRRLLEQAAEWGQRAVDTLVNNAGTNPHFGPLCEASDGAWQKTLDVNLSAAFQLTRAAVPDMTAAGGGCIINVASVAGLHPAEHQGVYSVSKAALVMLSRVLARELGPQRIRVNCLCPGLIQTRLSAALWSNADALATITGQTPLGRMGTPDEIAAAAVFLASDAGSFTTGAVLPVDGGLTA